MYSSQVRSRQKLPRKWFGLWSELGYGFSFYPEQALFWEVSALRELFLFARSQMSALWDYVPHWRVLLSRALVWRFHFGDFHYDAVLVRRVSLWRASTSARFSLARFPILYLS